MTTNSAIEFLIWLLIAASVIAVLAGRLRIPYTVALVIGGLALGSVRLPIVATLVKNQPDWLTPNIVLVIFLPALLFEGSLKLQVRQLRENAFPIALLATAGVLVATLVTGFAAHWLLGLPLLVALVFRSHYRCYRSHLGIVNLQGGDRSQAALDHRGRGEPVQ